MFVSFAINCILHGIDALLLIAGWVKSLIYYVIIRRQQSGAVEACWAHNPEVRGSKARSASKSLLPITIFKGVLLPGYLFLH